MVAVVRKIRIRTHGPPCRRRTVLLCRTRTYATASSSTPPPDEYDIVVVGGGPAGLALAAGLASSQAVYETSRIALIEAGNLEKTRAWRMGEGEFSNRVSSITNVSKEFLQRIGAWDHLDESRTMPVEEIQAWDGLSDARITFNTSDIPSASPSHSPYLRPRQMATMVENLNLQRALLRFLEDKPEVQLLDNVKVASISRNAEDEVDDYPHVSLSDGRILRTRLLIGADGHSSPVRAYAQIGSYGWQYPTHAVVATLQHRANPLGLANNIAFQRFLPTGPIAFLPLSATASSLVWSTRPQYATALKALEPAALATYINAAFRLPTVSVKYLYDVLVEAHESGSPLTPSQAAEEVAFRERSHGIEPQSALSSDSANAVGIPALDADQYPPLVTSIQPGTVAGFPLRLMHADAYIGSSTDGRGRTALVGDAAHNVHPLAGQGLNMGLADVQELVKCIEEGVMTGSDIGVGTTLQPYARNRYLANHAVLSVTDKLHKLYGAESGPVVWVRSAGLEIVNELAAVKGALMTGAGAAREEPDAKTAAMRFAADALEVGASTLHGARAVLSGLGTLAGTAVGTAIGNIITSTGKR